MELVNIMFRVRYKSESNLFSILANRVMSQRVMVNWEHSEFRLVYNGIRSESDLLSLAVF